MLTKPSDPLNHARNGEVAAVMFQCGITEDIRRMNDERALYSDEEWATRPWLMPVQCLEHGAKCLVKHVLTEMDTAMSEPVELTCSMWLAVQALRKEADRQRLDHRLKEDRTDSDICRALADMLDRVADRILGGEIDDW
jgi:hypothetical protein